MNLGVGGVGRGQETNIQSPTVGENVEKLDLSYIAGGKVKWYSHLGKEFGNSSNVRRRYQLSSIA